MILFGKKSLFNQTRPQMNYPAKSQSLIPEHRNLNRDFSVLWCNWTEKFCPSCVAGTFCSAVLGSMCSGAVYIPSDNEEIKCLRTGCYGYNNDFLTFACVLTDTRCFLRRKCTLQVQSCRSRWPRGLRHRSANACLLGLRVRIPPGAELSLVSVVCYQVEFSVTARSLVQKSPIECGVSNSVWSRNLNNEAA